MATHEFVIHATVPTVPLTIGGGNPPITNANTFGGSIPGIFDGTLPNSTMIIDAGDTVIVRLINDLPHPTGIHWHGLELANFADGTELTQDEVAGAPTPIQTLGNGVPAGGTFLYKFIAPNPGIFWFHPHHHHSTDAVFKGQYGIFIVRDAAEISLVTSGVLPSAANTHQLVLSDITVCKAVNDTDTYPAPVGGVPEWMGSADGVTSQNGPSPEDLCVLNPLNPDGSVGGSPFAAGQVPITFRMVTTPGSPPTVEGQTVLTNGVNVGGRGGTPEPPIGPAPSPDPGYTFITAEPGQGIRLQIANTATTRYFRLILTTAAGVKIDLIRVGGEGGILNRAVRDGGLLGSYDTKYSEGELLVPPASRFDVVAVIPLGTNLSTCTMWTRDFQRTGGIGWSGLPTVPVLHINVGNSPVPLFPMVHGTALKSTTATPVALLGAATSPGAPFLTPSTFGKIGAPSVAIPSQDIALTTGGGGMNGINGVQGMYHVMPPNSYTSIANLGATRFARNGDILEFNVVNSSQAHHPFHLHGFSFQPISIRPNGAPTASHTWAVADANYVDTFDVPKQHTVTFRVHISDRPLADGLTLGGAFGRWFFHCHIFFHAHHGMISELVITDNAGQEKPNVNVHGSWAYAPKPGLSNRTGTFHSRDGRTVTLTAHLDNGTPIGTLVQTGTTTGTWSWTFDTEAAPVTAIGTYYVYVTAQDSLGLKDQAVFRLKVGIPDDGSDNGDPHIHTVDGKNYDFQSVGEFTLLKDNDGLEVQTRQSPVLTANPITDGNTGIKACVSLNTAVALRVGSHRISYQYKNGTEELLFFVDGKQTNLPRAGLNLDGNFVSFFDANGIKALRVDYAHHAVVIVTPRYWTPHESWYFNISINRTQANQGIMGAIPNGTWLPLLPSGQSVGPIPASIGERFDMLYKTFANAWRLTDQSSLFTYEKGTSTKTFTDLNWPSEKPPCKLKPGLGNPDAPIFKGMPVDRATEFCRIVTDEGLNKDCIFDVATTGDESFAEMYRDLQEIREKAIGVQIGKIKDRIVIIVTPLKGKQPTPKGSVTLYVDGKQNGEPINLDENGRVEVKIGDLGKGIGSVQAVFESEDSDVKAPGFSPVLSVGENEDQPNQRTEVIEDPDNQTVDPKKKYWIWWLLVLLAILLILTIVWFLR